MIRKIIFDLDNTLIMWKEEYICALEKTIKKHNLELDAVFINNLIEDYEKYFDYYDKKILLDYINENIKIKIDMDFIDDFLYYIGFFSEPVESVINTLDYLSKKYELVVLTNWFQIPQINRLKNAKIYEYFNNVIGGDEMLKPKEEAFIKACNKTLPNECLMVGDDYNIDIIGAHNAGLQVIYLNQNNKENKLKFREIKQIEELKNIL